MSTSKKTKQSKSPQTHNLKIQPKYRSNRWSTSMVPEIKFCGNWLEKLPQKQVKYPTKCGS